MSLKRYVSQAGDTIVEVMFAVTVVGMVIGGSYVVATRALRTGRYAQEQTEALKQAEAQIEKLKYLATKGLVSTNLQSIFNPAAGQTTFCINDSLSKILESSTVAFAADCKLRGADKLYDVLVTYTAAPTTGKDLFVVTVSWDRQGTDTRGSSSIAYRLHNAPPPL